MHCGLPGEAVIRRVKIDADKVMVQMDQRPVPEWKIGRSKNDAQNG